MSRSFDPVPQIGAGDREHFRGRWESRHWLNVPGPFYGAETDNCGTGRLHAPAHVLYEAEYGAEYIWRQPRDPAQTAAVVDAAAEGPCALVLATMPPLLSAIANAGRHGVLVKSAVAMERLGQIDTAALDKTGTLTEGAPTSPPSAPCPAAITPRTTARPHRGRRAPQRAPAPSPPPGPAAYRPQATGRGRCDDGGRRYGGPANQGRDLAGVYQAQGAYERVVDVSFASRTRERDPAAGLGEGTAWSPAGPRCRGPAGGGGDGRNRCGRGLDVDHAEGLVDPGDDDEAGAAEAV